MLRFFKRGGIFVKNSVTLFVPVLIFVSVSYALDAGLPLVALSQPLASQLIAFVLTPAIFFIFLFTVCVDGVATLFLSSDIYFASQSLPNRWSRIFRGFSAADWLYYIVFVVGWHALFALIGISTIFVSDLVIGAVYVKIGVIIAIAVPLFPIFYSGLAVGAFVLVLHRFQRASVASMINISLQNTSRLYSFHAVRAFLDMLTLFGIPIILAFVVPNHLLGLIATILISGISFTFTRAASVSFKLDLFKTLITNQQ